MLGKFSRRSQLRAAVDSIVRSLVPSASNRGKPSAPKFLVEALEERQLLTVLTIAQENALTGSPVSAWNVAGGGDANLNGFSTDISVNQGDTVSFKVDDKNSAAYSISIYRLGYYQNLGARLVTTIASPIATAQPTPIEPNDSTGLIDCGNWSVSASWNVPSDATSGLYIADLVRGTSPVSQIPFVVRDDADHSAILYQTSDSTWAAYNSYGGNSLYETTMPGGLGQNDDGNTPRAFSVSYNRPFINRGENSGPQEGYIFGSEYPMIRFLEQNGYDVSYATDVDTARYGAHLLDHKTILTNGHDEYWSPEQRNNMIAARDHGVNMALFSGNAGFWKTRWAASSDASHTAWRTIVCYKETLPDAKIDPTSDFTGTWRDPRFPTYYTQNPENAFNGTISEVNGVRSDSLSVSYPDSLDRFWRNSTVASLTSGQTTTFPAGTLGYEWDEDLDNGFRPAGLIDMSHTVLTVTPKMTLDYGGEYGAGVATHSLTLYRAPSGALVFSAGETQWAWGLDTNHDRAGGVVQPAMQQATINLLADMGAQPSTIMSGLVAATASTDHTAPTSVISAPTPNATFTNGIPVTLNGTATDAGGGIVAGVEISVDNGATWHPAVGTSNWTYTWVPRVNGNTRILTRATDDSGNTETASPGRGVVVSATGPFGVFTNATTPVTAATVTASAATLGMRFSSDIAGQVLGVRFYKGTSNTGTHIGSLWSDSGTLLASATFSGESASGWQQVTFSNPVTIQAHTTYVVSYFAPNGRYFGDDGGLGRIIDSGTLHAPANGTLANGTTPEGNGTYVVAATNTFPNTADEETNFFVDVVFQAQPGDTTRPTIIAQSPAAGPASLPVSAVSITFSESIEASTLSFTLVAPGNVIVPATVSYASATHIATLTPNAALAPGTAYAVRVTANDLALNSLASPYTSSFTTPQNYSLWTPSTTPGGASGTTAGIEVGVRFKSDVAGYISGLMFYKDDNNTGTHVGDLWSNSGALLASATFTNESASGWQSVNFASPVAITANTLYVASYFAPNGDYSLDNNYFSAARDNAPLHAPANGAGGFANGVSIATNSSGVFPTASASGANFWVDVVLSSGNVDTTPPIVASTAPVSGASGASLTAPITATFDGPINSSSLTFTLKGPGNVTVPVTLSYNSATNTATLTPTAFLASGTAYTASISATDANGNTMTSPYTWSFTTVTVPVIVSRYPAINGTAAAETTPITATFNEGIVTSSLVFTLTGPGNISIPATVTYNASTLTATLQPSAALSSSTSFTVSISASDQSGNPMPAPTTWSFTSAAAGTTFSVWPSTTVPGTTAKSDSTHVELGMRFTSDSSGYITGIRFYKGTGNNGTHIGNLWSDTNTTTPLATATFTNESAGGWQQVLFSSPVAITAGTTYVASYFAPVGHYADDSGYFTTSHDNAPLHGQADGMNGEANGLYIYSATSKFPSNSVDSSNYWVDVVFMTVPPPNQVLGAAAAAGPNQNLISWSAAARAVSYNVYRGTSAGNEAATPIATGVTTLTFTDTGLTPGTTYFYKITAVNAAGEGTRSAEISATPIKATPAFSGISSSTLTYGAGTTTLSGVIAAGTQIPSGNVGITINGVTVNAPINATTGAFSVSFDTHAIPASSTAYVVTYSFTANANFSAASDTSHTLTVNKRTLNVTATGVNRIYDGTSTASVTFVDDRINSDVLTIGYTAAFANKNVGTGKSISVTAIAISGAGAGNYTLASTTATTSANVTARALTVSATGVSRVYNATNGATVTLGDNRAAGDTLSLAYGSALFADKNVANGKTVSVSGITVSGTDAANYTSNATASTTANITPFALTVTATGQNKIYNAATNGTVTLGSNRFSGDTVSLSYSGAAYADKNVGNSKPISVTGIGVTGPDANNYTWNTTASTTANITTFTLVVTASAQNKTYDGTPAASATLGDNRFVGDTLTVGFSSASFANKNAGTGRTVTVSGITVTGSDAANYTFNTTATTTATIQPFTLTVTATGVNKTYDGGVAETVSLNDNRISGDLLTLAYANATFGDKNVGSAKAVSVAGINVTGADGANYTWNTTASTTASITPFALSVTATGVNKAYNGSNAATVTLGDNRIGGDVLTVAYGSAAFSDKNAGVGKPVNASGITVTGIDSGNYTWNTSATTTATISTIALTVGAIGQSRTYDGTTAGAVTLTDNRISGDLLTLTYGSATFADKNVGTGKPVSVSGINVTGTDAANYTFNTTTSTTAAITALALTVTATGQDRTYNQTTAATVTLGDNRVAGDSLSLGYGAATFADKNAGTAKTVSVSGITVTGTDAGNYTFNTTATTSATITPLALTVTAAGQNKVYDGTSAASVTLGDNRLSGDQFTLTYGSATFANKNVGAAKTISVSGITATGADASNYTFSTTATASAGITPFALTVSASGVSRVYNGSAAATVVLADNRISGDSLTVSSTSATFSDKNVGTGKTVSVTGINVIGADAGNYTFNTTASTSANITVATLTVAAVAANKAYDRTIAATATLSDNRASGDVLNLAYTTATFSDKNAGANKTVAVSGITVTGADAANYTFNTTASAAATITPIALTVTAAGSNKVYDGTPATTVTLGDNRLPGDSLTVTYGIATFADKNAGIAKTVSISGINVTGTDATNYTFNTTASTTANITPLALSIGATGQNKQYDRTTAATVTLNDNRISGDVLTISYGSAAFADKNVGTTKTVTVSGINVAGTDAGNYTFNSSTTTTANITALALAVTVTAQSKAYDRSATATIAFGDNRLAGDALTFGYGSALFSDKNVGVNKTVTVTGITLGGADAGNYTFNTTATATASISAIALTVGVTAQSKVYDGRTNVAATLTDNRLPGDSLTIAFGSASFSNKNVGVNKVVTVSGINVTGADAINYTFNTSATTAATITPATLMVTASAQNRSYNGGTAATTTLSDNRITGDSLTLSSAAASFADKNAGANKTVTVTGINVTGTDAGNYTFNTTATTSANITAAALLVSASALSRSYNGGTAASATLSDNRITGDSLTLSFGAANFADKNVGANKTVTVTGINVTGTDAGNYTFNATATTSANITAATLAVSASALSRSYNGGTAASATLSDNRISGDSLTLSFAASNFADKNVGVNKVVTVSGINVTGADSINYTFNTSATTSATITPATLTVTASAQNRSYNGGTAASATLSDNRITGDSLTLSSTAANLSDKNVGANKTVTVTGINVAGTDAGNYTFNTTSTTLATITPATLTVTASAQNRSYNGGSAASATLSDNRITGDSLSLSFAAANFADKNVGANKTVTVSGINVTGIDAGNYTFNTAATASANITAATLIVTASAQNRSYNGGTAASATLSDNRIAGDSMTLSFTAANFADKNVGTNKTVTVTGINVTGTDAGNYTFNTTATASANITTATLLVTATGQNKTYDRSTSATVTLGDNRFAGDALTVGYATAAFSDKNAGVGKTVTISGISVTGADAANYTFNSTANATATISKFALTVGAVGQSKVYDPGTAGTVTLTDNRLAGDSLTLSYGAATYADKNVGIGKAISVSGINVTGTDSTNYTFNATATSTGTITPRPLAITATASNKPYDGTTTANASVSGDNHISGDAVTVSFTSATFSNMNVGTGKTVTLNGVTLGGTDAMNYTAGTVTASADITPELVVTGTSAADTLRLMLDADGTHVDWFLNGTSVIGQLASNDAAGLTINAGASGMTINLDRTNGNPLPALLNLNGVFTLNGLQGTDPLAGTTLNINRSTIYLTYADAAHDPINGIRDDIHTGYNAGSWSGSSTVSTGSVRSATAAADASQTTGIGYADSSSGLVAGQPANTVELKYTLYADTGLVGSVGFTDFSRLGQHWGQNGGATWGLGDFNYDGSVGTLDFFLLGRTYNTMLPAAPAAEASIPIASPLDQPAPGATSAMQSTWVPLPGSDPRTTGSTVTVSATPFVSRVNMNGLRKDKKATKKADKKHKTPIVKVEPQKAAPREVQLGAKKDKA